MQAWLHGALVAPELFQRVFVALRHGDQRPGGHDDDGHEDDDGQVTDVVEHEYSRSLPDDDPRPPRQGCFAGVAISARSSRSFAFTVRAWAAPIRTSSFCPDDRP